MAKEVKTLREYKHHEDKRGGERILCDHFKREIVELQVLKLGNNKSDIVNRRGKKTCVCKKTSKKCKSQDQKTA